MTFLGISTPIPNSYILEKVFTWLRNSSIMWIILRQEFRSEKQTIQLHCAPRHYSIRIIIAITYHDSYYRSWQGAEEYGTSNAQNSSGQNKQIWGLCLLCLSFCHTLGDDSGMAQDWINKAGVSKRFGWQNCHSAWPSAGLRIKPNSMCSHFIFVVKVLNRKCWWWYPIILMYNLSFYVIVGVQIKKVTKKFFDVST